MTLLCAAFVLGASLSRSEIVVTPPAVTVAAPQVTVAPAPVVMPPTPVVVEAPAPPPPPDPPAPAPQPRALVPMLDAGCVIGTSDGAANPTCAWDDGLPAISQDGALIATKYYLPMGPSDLFGLSIHFLDTRTGRVVRDSVILTPDESALGQYAESTASGDAQDKQLQQRQRLLAKIYRRVAAVQRTLDAGRFRTLHLLGSTHASSGGDPTSQRGPDPIYAEIAGTAARIIDSAKLQVLWRGEFAAPRPKHSDPSSDCGGWTPWSIALWWDPQTRHVLAAQTYRTGGCMCPDVPVDNVQQMP